MSVLEIVCPAGTPDALRVAVDEGADVVYVGFRDETNARNFPGLNFSRAELADALDYAHARDCHVYLAVNTYPRAGSENIWHKAVDDAAAIGVDALILADIGLLHYACSTYPDLRLHLSVQASASNPDAITFYQREFGVKRVVLPRVLTVAEIQSLNTQIDVETEVFAFGGLCPMAEGRCSLSSYITGKSPNQHGVCSPASHVRYTEKNGEMVSSLGDFTINRFAAYEQAGYPTLCKGRFKAMGQSSYLFEEPTSLNIIPLLPTLAKAGITALKIEGRQRGKAYVRDVVRLFRNAVDAVADGVAPDGNGAALCEGGQQTTGAYKRQWK